MRQRTISSFFDNEYLEYAKYVVSNRAIPHLIDGLKPSQRKIVHVANKIWKPGNTKQMKLFQLAGRVAADAYYHHGNSSLEGAMVNMAQTFKNSLPLLRGHGQFGTLREPEAGAARYIGASLHPNFHLVYKDFDLLEPKMEEGYEIEPEFFLPVIPTVILNGTSGIAVGFATKIFNRKPLDVITACMDVLNEKKIKPLIPWINDFTGEFKRSGDTAVSWSLHGRYRIVNTTTVHISEIPPNITCENYEKHLIELLDKKIISDYEDNSAGNIDYTIKFRRANLKDYITKRTLEKVLKLTSKDTENLTVIDETGKLKVFASAEDIVRHFVDVRLTYYDLRKTRLISNFEKEITRLSNMARFIKDIIDGKLKVNNVPKIKIVAYLEKNKYNMMNESFAYLLNMPIYSLTKERFEDLLQKKGNAEAELADIRTWKPKNMYLKDLTKLKKELT
jgi:DNA gyrase/topoisomerase IV subunit A